MLFSPENGTGEDGRLFSLMNINDVVCSLLQKQPYKVPHCDHVKIGRSEIYNPDFHFIYQKMGEPHRLLAFEGFLFATGEKLIVYADGAVELYDRKDDSRIEDAMRMQALLKCVQREITVCSLDVICVP